MAINVIELAGSELVEGIAYAQDSISWTELVDRFGIARANQIVQEIAQDSYWLDFGGSDIGATYIGTEYITSGGAPAAISSTVDTALELAQSNTMVAEEVSITPIGQGALATGSNTAQTCSLLSLDVGVVGAALAPILGVSLGIGLYENNPKFWTQLSQKLLPFCYPGTTEIPGWLDIVESALHPGEYESQVIIDERVYQALKDFFDEEGYGAEYVEGATGPITIGSYTLTGPLKCYKAVNENVVIGFNNWGGPTILEWNSSNPLYITWVDDSGEAIFASTEYLHFNMTAYDANMEPKGTINFITSPSSYVNDDKRAYYQYANLLDPFYWFTSVTIPHSITGGPGDGLVAWYLVYGDLSIISRPPEGTSAWDGDAPSTSPYSKDIIYISEDEENPGSYNVITRPGLKIALPEQPEKSVQTDNISKPDDWPEEEPWPMEIEFPWEAPEGVEDWPETMPWPLPSTRPDWWPDGLPYPSTFPMPSPTVEPESNPNPNINKDPVIPTKYITESAPGIEIAPVEETPAPAIDPSKPGTIPDVAVDGTPPSPDPPVPSGESPVPVLPTIPVPFTSANDGLISVYHPTDAQLKAFASWLWVTYADPSIDKLWNNPFDGVIGLMEIYCTPTDIGAKNIRSGFLDSGVSSQTISRYTSIDCGSITVPEYYGDYFDYSPYSKCHIYLPFIGMVELNVDDIVGHAVNVTYHIDEYNGCCIAQITVAKSTEVAGEDVDYNVVMYQFSGNCAVELPLAGGTQSAIRAAMMQAAAYGLSSVVGGIASGVAGNIGGAISQIGYGAANAVGSIVSAKSSVQHSGSFGSSYGALGIKIPYIVVTRPKEIIVPDYNKIYGYPAHKMVTIGACRGYLRVRDVHILSSTATDDEKKRIEELLKEGVYVTEE